LFESGPKRPAQANSSVSNSFAERRICLTNHLVCRSRLSVLGVDSDNPSRFSLQFFLGADDVGCRSPHHGPRLTCPPPPRPQDAIIIRNRQTWGPACSAYKTTFQSLHWPDLTPKNRRLRPGSPSHAFLQNAGNCETTLTKGPLRTGHGMEPWGAWRAARCALPPN